MTDFRLCAFADEASGDLAGQIEALRRNGMRLIEIRNVGRKAVTDLSDEELDDVAKTLHAAGIEVWSIGSPLGKTRLEDTEENRRRFERSVEAAKRLGTTRVRMFSYYVSEEEADGAADAIAALRGLGVKDITMLTGDAEAAARGAAEQLGITSVRAGLLPEDKVAEVGKLRSQGGKVLFVGDGLNDAPVLAAADVSIAMANGRNRISVEAADAVIMSGSPARVTDAVRVGRRTVGIVRENTAFALAAKGVVLILAALGFAPMWAAVFADVGVCLLAVLNALRALK